MADEPVAHEDVMTVTSILGDIRSEVVTIRILLEEDDREEEEDPETDA